MVKKSGITTPIYKLDTDAVIEFFGGNVEAVELPALIVERYNKEKGLEVYGHEGGAEIGGGTFSLYRNMMSRPNTSGWVTFFQGSGIELDELKNQMQHLVCFVVVDDELYAYTAGQSAVVFERFIDIAFPIEVGRRIAKPEVKGARSSQITGGTLASDVHFRDPRRITYTESLDNVWTALSGQLQDTVLDEKALASIFGIKSKIRLDVTSAIKLGPRIESPQKMVELIRWLALKADADLPKDDGWAGLDAIKILNPRKKKDLIGKLKIALAKKIFLKHDYSNLSVAHVDAAIYDNATSYLVCQDKTEVLEMTSRPELADIVPKITVDPADLLANFANVTIETENSDYGSGFGTSGPLLGHLHGEVSYEKKTYYLLAGKWYEVDAVYIEQITKDFLATMDDLDIDPKVIGLKAWRAADTEEVYNRTSVEADTFINGDRVLTDNVELFDGIATDGKMTYLLHVKRDFDVKVRDVRSQVINSAQIIENDIRTGSFAKLKQHYAALKRRGRTDLTEEQFLELFQRPRTYVLAYGSKVKVAEATIGKFGSSVARMEVVSLSNQFRQLSSAESQAKLRITWIELV